MLRLIFICDVPTQITLEGLTRKKIELFLKHSTNLISKSKYAMVKLGCNSFCNASACYFSEIVHFLITIEHQVLNASVEHFGIKLEHFSGPMACHQKLKALYGTLAFTSSYYPTANNKTRGYCVFGESVPY